MMSQDKKNSSDFSIIDYLIFVDDPEFERELRESLFGKPLKKPPGLSWSEQAIINTESMLKQKKYKENSHDHCDRGDHSGQVQELEDNK
jgi:hypothetical protein